MKVLMICASLLSLTTIAYGQVTEVNKAIIQCYENYGKHRVVTQVYQENNGETYLYVHDCFLFPFNADCSDSYERLFPVTKTANGNYYGNQVLLEKTNDGFEVSVSSNNDTYNHQIDLKDCK